MEDIPEEIRKEFEKHKNKYRKKCKVIADVQAYSFLMKEFDRADKVVFQKILIDKESVKPTETISMINGLIELLKKEREDIIEMILSNDKEYLH